MECLANGTIRLRHTTVQSRTCSPHHTWGPLQGIQTGCCTHHNSRALPTGEGDLNTKHSIIGQGPGTHSHCTGIHLCVCVCRGGGGGGWWGARILRIELSGVVTHINILPVIITKERQFVGDGKYHLQ